MADTEFVHDVKFEGTTLTIDFGTTTVTIDASMGTVALFDGELGDKRYMLNMDHNDEVRKFGRWLTDREDEEDEEPETEETPNRFEVLVNLGNGRRADVLANDAVLDDPSMDPKLWLHMAHHLLRFATNRISMVADGNQVDQSPANVGGRLPSQFPSVPHRPLR